MPEGQASYQLRYLPLFWDDLNEAVSYVADVLHNPAAAERLLDRTEEGMLAHLANPTACTIYKRKHDGPSVYYWFPVGNYMVFYVVEGNIMEVRRFLFGSRDLTKARL